jgi:hypothetical protein
MEKGAATLPRPPASPMNPAYGFVVDTVPAGTGVG